MLKGLKRAEMFVLVCQGSDCKKRGGKKLRKQAKQILKDQGMRRRSVVIKTKCTGNCKRAPICGLLPSGEWLGGEEVEELEEGILRQIEALEG